MYFNLLVDEIKKDRQLGADPKNIELVRFLFPSNLVYIKLPAFNNGSYVLVGNKAPSNIPDDSLFLPIAATKDITNIKVLSELVLRVVELPKKYQAYFLNIDDDLHLNFLKLLLLGCAPKDIFQGTPVGTGKLWDLFANLYSSYSILYEIYQGSNIPYKVLFSGLLTLFLKMDNFQSDGNVKLSNSMLNVISANRHYLPEIKQQVYTYLKSPQQEMDFLNLLLVLSADRFRSQF